ncbi:MAG: PIG-L family deacetylase [Ruminococcaceae bacterium]|nr:PIG-L family deacetylase [Oscillospiraceae bacterium]
MKILAIGAHQDDNEFRVGGMAHKWVQAGHEVRFLSLCNGCGGHHIMTPEETTARRAKESAKVAEFLGIEYDVWDIDDCTIVADLPTRERLIRYIRSYSPDLIITHRTNDYHADHRAAGQLVQDASYILTVPHTCPDVPAMREMPVIVYNEDGFKNPVFTATYVIDMNDEIDTKLHIAHLNESQVYEWLPYTYGQTVPEGEAERFAFLKGMEITEDTTDEEVMSVARGYAVRFAKTAARFRRELIERYGEERGSKVRYAEAFELCEYGKQPSPEMEKELFGF